MSIYSINIVNSRTQISVEEIIVCCDIKAVTPTLAAHLSPLGASEKHRVPVSSSEIQ